MTKKIKELIKKIDKSPQQKIFLLILLPALLGVLFSFMSLFSFRNTYKNNLKDTYISTLKNFSENEEKSIASIAYSIRILSGDRQFVDTVNGFDTSEENILYTQAMLKKIAMNYGIVDSINVVDRTNSRVYTQNSTYDFKDFFTNIYKYENYGVNYWNTYIAPVSEKYTLPPTIVKTQHGEKTIVPLLFTKIGEKHTSNLIVVNINLSSVLESFSSYAIFSKSTVSMINKKTRQNFYSDVSEVVSDPNFLEKLSDDMSECFDYNIYGKKSFIVSYSPSYSALGYIYLISTPYSILSKSMPVSLNILFVVNCLIFIIILILSFRESESVYMPFKKIADLFPNRKGSSFDDLHNIISDILGSNKKMQQQLEHSLPLIEEQKLIRLLNSAEHYTDIDSNAFGNFSGFVNDYFCSVIIKLSPTKSFYEKYDNITEKTIELGIYNLVKSEFSQKFEHMYIIPSNEHTLYIILNPDNIDTKAMISETIKQIEDAFAYDASDLNIAISAGSVREGLAGLKQSHEEATNELSSVNPFTHVHIQIENDDAENKASFTFANETALYNHLIASNIEKSSQLMEKKYTEYIKAGASTKDFYQLFTHYFSLIFKVMKLKNIDYDTERKGDSILIEDILRGSKNEIWNSINTLLDILKKQSESKKIDINSIISYIQQNYNKDIYQEQLAEKFGTSASYLSRLIKKETSVSFSEYVNILRINEAKTLLETTDMTIKDVYETVGFNNRNTFIRTFKSIIGTTPSEFKKRNSK